MGVSQVGLGRAAGRQWRRGRSDARWLGQRGDAAGRAGGSGASAASRLVARAAAGQARRQVAPSSLQIWGCGGAGPHTDSIVPPRGATMNPAGLESSGPTCRHLCAPPPRACTPVRRRRRAPPPLRAAPCRRRRAMSMPARRRPWKRPSRARSPGPNLGFKAGGEKSLKIFVCMKRFFMYNCSRT